MSIPNAPASASATYTAPSPSPTWWGPSLNLKFDAKTTLIYIGGSLGVLGVIMALLMLTMILWVRPTRQRRLQALARERHRLETLQEVKVEADNFQPQVRAFPIVVLQPDDHELACGRKISLDVTPLPSTPMADTYQDIETGQVTASSRILEAKASGALETSSSGAFGEPSSNGQPCESSKKDDEEVSYNPLTHYLTERQPHLFIAEVSREHGDS